MSKKQFGNNLLYLLSEKKSLKWAKFKSYAEYLCRQNELSINEHQRDQYSKILPENIESYSQKTEIKSNICFWTLLRNLSSMAYLDIMGKTGETVVKIAPPMLVELPFFQPMFLLTGARSPDLLKTIKKSAKNAKIELKIKTHSLLPDTFLIKPDNKIILQSYLENTGFQGNKLSDYIRISENPPAWSILEFAGSVKDYEQSLKDDYCSGDKTHIKEIFNIDSLRFKDFDPHKDNLRDDFSLVKIFHPEQFYKYYLFSKRNEDRAEIQPDWGKYLVMAKYSENPVLEYNKKTFELSSFLPLPFFFERGLALLSGHPPTVLKKSSTKYKKTFVFKNVPYKIALLVAQKLGQNLKEI